MAELNTEHLMQNKELCQALTKDPVNHPTHYTTSPAKCKKCGEQIECIDITEHMSFCLGNAFKYIWRCDMKGVPVEDLQKAVWYVQREIDKRKKK